MIVDKVMMIMVIALLHVNYVTTNELGFPP